MFPLDSFGFRVNALPVLRFDAFYAVLLAIIQFHHITFSNVSGYWIVVHSRATFLLKSLKLSSQTSSGTVQCLSS